MWTRAPIVAVVATVSLLLTACSSSWPRRDPTGERFPTVRGQSLEGTEVVLPSFVEGQGRS